MKSNPSEATAARAPLVSIVLPCYNSQRFLNETLSSIRNQSYANWELIAVDDCSTDETANLLSAAAIHEPRIRIIQRETRGGRPSITKNTGLQYATGEYIAFIDHDDKYFPGKIEALVNILERHPNHVAAFHDLEYIDGESHPQGKRYIPDFLDHAKEHLTQIEEGAYSCDERFPIFQVLQYSGIQTTSCLLAKNRLPSGLITYDTQYTITDDKDLWVRLSLQGRLVFVNQVLGQYRVHENNLSNDSFKSHSDICKLLRVNIERLGHITTEFEKKRLRDLLAKNYCYLAWSLRCKGQGLQAAKIYGKSMALNPSLNTLAALLKSGIRP